MDAKCLYNKGVTAEVSNYSVITKFIFYTGTVNMSHKISIVIFGTGKVSDVIATYIESDDRYDIVAFTCDAKYCNQAEFRGKPLIPFEKIEETYSSESYKLLMAVGYHDLNNLRHTIFQAAIAKGYEVISYISPMANVAPGTTIGHGCVILIDADIQPGVVIGDNVVVWNNAVIGHHATISEDCWLASGVTIGGSSKIMRSCFLGLNSTVGHEIEVGERSFIGACALVLKNKKPGSVLIERETESLRLNSDQFLKISNMP